MIKVTTITGDIYVIYDNFIFQKIDCKSGDFDVGQIADNLEDTLFYLKATIINE